MRLWMVFALMLLSIGCNHMPQHYGHGPLHGGNSVAGTGCENVNAPRGTLGPPRLIPKHATIGPDGNYHIASPPQVIYLKGDATTGECCHLHGHRSGCSNHSPHSFKCSNCSGCCREEKATIGLDYVNLPIPILRLFPGKKTSCPNCQHCRRCAHCSCYPQQQCRIIPVMAPMPTQPIMAPGTVVACPPPTGQPLPVPQMAMQLSEPAYPLPQLPVPQVPVPPNPVSSTPILQIPASHNLPAVANQSVAPVPEKTAFSAKHAEIQDITTQMQQLESLLNECEAHSAGGHLK